VRSPRPVSAICTGRIDTAIFNFSKLWLTGCTSSHVRCDASGAQVRAICAGKSVTAVPVWTTGKTPRGGPTG
jgi:hypothetical protein